MSAWVTIPTYNERENITKLIQMLFTLPTPDLFVLIVDDNSPDGTAEVVKNLQSQYPNLHIEIRQTKEGLGPAYIHGFTYALKHGATEVVHMDADLSHDPADVPKLLAELRDHDVVIGSRYCHGISVINWPLKRLLISLMGNTYARFITGLPVKDATGGFKAWKEQTLRDIAYTTVSTDGYGFHIVTTYRAWKKGKKIMEVPIIFTERRDGQSKMSRSIVLEAFMLVWKLRLGFE